MGANTTYVAQVGRPTDLSEFVDLYRAAEEADEGRPRIDRDWIDTQFRDTGFDPDTDIVTVRDAEGTLVGAAMFESRDPFVSSFCSKAVLPSVRDDGVGTMLMEFAIDRAQTNLPKAPEGARVTVSVGVHEVDERMRRLLDERGFTVERYFHEMEIELDADIDIPDDPDGVTFRTLGPDEPLDALVVTVRDSFRDHFGFVDQPLEMRLQRWGEFRKADSWDDDLVFLAEADGELIGVNVSLRRNGSDNDQGYVATLGVLPAWRGKGIARQLLLMSFAEYRRRGMGSASLHVDADSITGATRLYEGVGMRATQVHLDYELQLRDGEDLVRR